MRRANGKIESRSPVVHELTSSFRFGLIRVNGLWAGRASNPAVFNLARERSTAFVANDLFHSLFENGNITAHSTLTVARHWPYNTYV